MSMWHQNTVVMSIIPDCCVIFGRWGRKRRNLEGGYSDGVACVGNLLYNRSRKVQEGFVHICNSSSERTHAHALKQCHRYF